MTTTTETMKVNEGPTENAEGAEISRAVAAGAVEVGPTESTERTDEGGAEAGPSGQEVNEPAGLASTPGGGSSPDGPASAPAPASLPHCFVDIETLGRRPGCVILQVGLVKFWEDPAELMDSVTVGFDPDAMILAGYVVESETAAWWEEQAPAVRAAAFGGSLTPQVGAARILSWLSLNGPWAGVWCRGASFDFPILKHFLAQYFEAEPWPHWLERDFRTLQRELDPGKALMPVTVSEGVGAHDAAWDAMRDALWLQGIWGRSRQTATPAEMGPTEDAEGTEKRPGFWVSAPAGTQMSAASWMVAWDAMQPGLFGDQTGSVLEGPAEDAEGTESSGAAEVAPTESTERTDNARKCDLITELFHNFGTFVFSTGDAAFLTEGDAEKGLNEVKGWSVGSHRLVGMKTAVGQRWRFVPQTELTGEARMIGLDAALARAGKLEIRLTDGDEIDETPTGAGMPTESAEARREREWREMLAAANEAAERRLERGSWIAMALVVASLAVWLSWVIWLVGK